MLYYKLGKEVHVSKSFKQLATTFVVKEGKLYKKKNDVSGAVLLYLYVQPCEVPATIKEYHENICSHSGWHRTHKAVCSIVTPNMKIISKCIGVTQKDVQNYC